MRQAGGSRSGDDEETVRGSGAGRKMEAGRGGAASEASRGRAGRDGAASEASRGRAGRDRERLRGENG